MIVDVHSHILPGIDDGSRNVETSVAMLREACAQGVELQVATPHFYAHRNRIERFLEKRAEAWAALAKELPEESPRILLGAEVAYFDKMSRAEDLGKLCIGDTNLLLLEMPFELWTDAVLDDVDALIRKRNFKVILAHLERFRSYGPNRRYMDDLMADGCLVQVNAEALLNLRDWLAVGRWFKDGKVDFLGSDAHGIHHRPPNLKAGRDALAKKCPQALTKIDAGASLLSI